MSADFQRGYLAGLRAAYVNPGSILVMIDKAEEALRVRESVEAEQAQRIARARIEGYLLEKNPEVSPALVEQLESAPKVKAFCGCFCHEELGGGVHKGQRCRCNGGEGYVP